MKKTLVTVLAAAALVASSYGQGTIAFGNSTGPTVNYEQVLNSGVFVPAPSSVSPRVELLWAPVGTTDISLFSLVPGNVVNVGIPVAGRFSGGTRTIPAGTGFAGIGQGAIVDVIVRGWLLGSGATYGEATVRGVSDIFTIDTGNPLAQPIAEVGTPITPQFPGLNLTAVPEPSSMALAGLGAASLLIFRRRK